MMYMSLNTVFILANSADPDEMLPLAFPAFYLAFHHLPKYLLSGIQNGNG